MVSSQVAAMGKTKSWGEKILKSSGKIYQAGDLPSKTACTKAANALKTHIGKTSDICKVGERSYDFFATPKDDTDPKVNEAMANIAKVQQ